MWAILVCLMPLSSINFYFHLNIDLITVVKGFSSLIWYEYIYRIKYSYIFKYDALRIENINLNVLGMI